MKIMSNQQPKVLVPYREPDSEVAIVVEKWIFERDISGQYVEYPRSARLVFDYIVRIGFLATFRKVRSRLAESNRNKKIFGIGIGFVSQSPKSSNLKTAQPVLFLAPNNNRENYVVLNVAFICPISTDSYDLRSSMRLDPGDLIKLIAWSPYAGYELNKPVIQSALHGIAEQIRSSKPLRIAKPLPSKFNGNFVDSYNRTVDAGDKPTAVLFGLGNYAKTIILPNVKRYVCISRIHEIDPLQLSSIARKGGVSVDTSPFPRADLRFDVWFISAFNHMHADLARAALIQGAVAVIEKPLSTSRSQYRSFIETLNNTKGSEFFLCFHKRYSKLNEFLFADLVSRIHEPINMHCIVFEIPLPPNHWYNWPNSGSRLISNGCHWIDYFLFVNNFSKVKDYKKWIPHGKDIVVEVRLENGAYFTMTLTDTGSQRLGVRDHIELRVGDMTITMRNSSDYIAENKSRVVRKAQVNPMSSYARMYRDICRRIKAGNETDKLETLASSNLVLLMEDA
jgi:predicted dehydrogenase